MVLGTKIIASWIRKYMFLDRRGTVVSGKWGRKVTSVSSRIQNWKNRVYHIKNHRRSQLSFKGGTNSALPVDLYIITVLQMPLMKVYT